MLVPAVWQVLDVDSLCASDETATITHLATITFEGEFWSIGSMPVSRCCDRVEAHL